MVPGAVNHHTLGKFKNNFERNVAKAIESLGSEYEFYPNLNLTGVGPNVEVDWILRYKNNFAVGEVKLHASKTAGIDQLNGITDQRTLGTYTRKFLISAEELHSNDHDLAQAYRIKVIVLPSGRQESLANDDRLTLIKAIRTEMEPKRYSSSTSPTL